MTEIWKDVKGYEGLYMVSDMRKSQSFREESPACRKT